MFYLIYFFIFFLGAALGSFLNVAAERLPQEKSLTGRSRCESCGRKLEFWDLVPIFSFLFLRGRCRSCGEKFSWRYFWTEAGAGVLFLLAFWKFAGNFTLSGVEGWDFIAIGYLFFAICLLVIIFLSDLKYYIIPDEAILAGLIGFAVYKLLSLFGRPPGGWEILGNPLLAAFVAGGFFLALVLISGGRWMGWGDVKLVFLMGLWLGWPNILAALFLAFLSGSVVGLGLIFAGRKTLKSQVPFGTFLAASTFVVLLWGQEILKWYWGLMG